MVGGSVFGSCIEWVQSRRAKRHRCLGREPGRRWCGNEPSPRGGSFTCNFHPDDGPAPVSPETRRETAAVVCLIRAVAIAVLPARAGHWPKIPELAPKTTLLPDVVAVGNDPAKGQPGRYPNVARLSLGDRGGDTRRCIHLRPPGPLAISAWSRPARQHRPAARAEKCLPARQQVRKCDVISRCKNGAQTSLSCSREAGRWGFLSAYGKSDAKREKGELAPLLREQAASS